MRPKDRDPQPESKFGRSVTVSTPSVLRHFQHPRAGTRSFPFGEPLLHRSPTTHHQILVLPFKQTKARKRDGGGFRPSRPAICCLPRWKGHVIRKRESFFDFLFFPPQPNLRSSRLQALYRKYSSIRSTCARSVCKPKSSIRWRGSTDQSTA